MPPLRGWGTGQAQFLAKSQIPQAEKPNAERPKAESPELKAQSLKPVFYGFAATRSGRHVTGDWVSGIPGP